MKININNYEAFFLDYKEGSLSHKQESELFLFLEQHPRLYEELHGFENVSISSLDFEENFANKNSIKKSDYTNENLIAYTEGILDLKSKNEIELLASQNNAFNKELKLYKSAYLQPDLNERVKNKAKLKRGGVVIFLQNNYSFLRVAAAVLLLIGLFFLVAKLNTKEKDTKNKIEIANVNKETVGSWQLVVGSQEVRTKKQEPRNENKEIKDTNQEENSKNLTPSINLNRVKQKNPKYKTRNNSNPQPEIKNIAINNFIKDNAPLNNQKDTLIEKIVLVNNNPPVNQNLTRSYFNYSADKDDDEDSQPVIASATSAKKSFFQKLTRVAKNINGFGIKKINATEENNSNTLMLGGLVVYETTASR